MARKRMIDPSIWADQKLGQLSRNHRLLFIGLISNADDEGRLVGHPSLLKSFVFPYDDDITAKDVDAWLTDLATSGVIQCYTVSGDRYIHVKNFSKWQYIQKPTPSNLPAPEGYKAPNWNKPKGPAQAQPAQQQPRREHLPPTPPRPLPAVDMPVWITDPQDQVNWIHGGPGMRSLIELTCKRAQANGPSFAGGGRQLEQLVAAAAKVQAEGDDLITELHA